MQADGGGLVLRIPGHGWAQGGDTCGRARKRADQERIGGGLAFRPDIDLLGADFAALVKQADIP